MAHYKHLVRSSVASSLNNGERVPQSTVQTLLSYIYDTHTCISGFLKGYPTHAAICNHQTSLWYKGHKACGQRVSQTRQNPEASNCGNLPQTTPTPPTSDCPAQLDSPLSGPVLRLDRAWLSPLNALPPVPPRPQYGGTACLPDANRYWFSNRDTIPATLSSYFYF